MFCINDDMSIFCTRGDYCSFTVTATIGGEAYQFQPGDVVRFKAFRKKDCATVVIQRDYTVGDATNTFTISLTGEDTKIGEIISKPVDYWYEVELNPDTNPQTIVGYDEAGAKVFKLFPEGKDVDADDIEVVGKKTLQELVDYALAEAKASGEFDGPQGIQGEKGEKGDTGAAGPQGAPGRDGTALIDDTAVGEGAWSAKNIVDKLCPAFSESGSIVACQPVAGYPMTVQAQEGATVTRCGKNLWDLKSGVTKVTYTSNGGTDQTRWGYRICLPPGIYTLHAEQAGEQGGGFLYGVVNGPDGSYLASASVVSNGLLTKVISLNEGDVIYLYDGANGSDVRADTLFSNYNVQIELGSTATAYEEYRGESFACAPTVTVPALPGVNTLWADTGEIAVSGRADPVAENAMLKSRLAALEAALINT